MAEGALDRREHPGEEVRLRLPPDLPGLELMRARFTTRSFPRHTHEGYGVGVIEQGGLRFFYRGETVVAPPGRINTVNPDEVHTGQRADENGWTYRMFYFTPEFLSSMALDIAGHSTALPFFNAGVIEDPALAGLLRQVHSLHCDDALPGQAQPKQALLRESLLLEAFARLLGRHTCAPRMAAPGSAGPESAAVARAVEYLHANFAGDIRLADLASAASLSRYHFLRVFARQTGLTPHFWLMQLRARAARRMLLRGVPIAQAAAQAGFADQSHLNKTFRRILGYTPGQLRHSAQVSNSVQGA